MRVGGLQHAVQLFWGFALDAVGHEDGAELDLGYAAFQHGGEEGTRVVLDQGTSTVCAAADFLDELGCREWAVSGGFFCGVVGEDGGSGHGFGAGLMAW